jgi:hypothetical protein
VDNFEDKLLAENEPECGVSPIRCNELLTSIHTQIGMIRRDYMKLFYLMFAMIAASMGVEFLGTPWYIHVMGYLTWLSGIFVLCTTFGFWKQLTIWQRLIRLEFSLMLLYSIAVRTFVFRVAVDLAPRFFGIGMTSFFILISFTLIIHSWREDGVHRGK